MSGHRLSPNSVDHKTFVKRQQELHYRNAIRLTASDGKAFNVSGSEYDWIFSISEKGMPLHFDVHLFYSKIFSNGTSKY